MAGPWEKYQERASAAPWARYASTPKEAPPDPSEGGSTLQFGPIDTGIPLGQGTTRFLTGMGKGMTDLVRGAGQYLGLVSREDIDRVKEQDAPLMRTGAGTVGNIAGTVVPLAPALVAAGPSIGAAAATGAAQGALVPAGTNDSRVSNILMGGALGAAVPIAMRGGQALWQGSKALLDPFTKSGQERVAGRVIERFADDPARVLAATQVTGPTRTGSLPTLAEQSGDVGIARLQDATRSLDPTISNALEAQLSGNNAARVSRLRELAGQGGGREAAVTARAQAAKPLYDQALAQTIDPALAPAGQQLMKSPAIREAAGQARQNALNAGTSLGNGGSMQGLHSTKLALDDMIAKAETGESAAAVNNAASLRAARDRLVDFIETASPDYQAARQTYAAMSRPVNQMDVGEQLLRGTSNTTDLPIAGGGDGVPRILPDRFLRSLREPEKLVKQATGRNLGGLDDVLSPEQRLLVDKIAQEVDRTAAVGRVGAGPGSATAQRMASQNLLRQVAGPTGLPESWVESALLTNVMRPVQFAYGTAEPAIQQTLARALNDPGYARTLLEAAAKDGGKKSLEQVSGLLRYANSGLLGATARGSVVKAGLLE